MPVSCISSHAVSHIDLPWWLSTSPNSVVDERDALYVTEGDIQNRMRGLWSSQPYINPITPLSVATKMEKYERKQEFHEPFHFICPNIVAVVGPTGCGKSQLVARILRDRHELIRPPPDAVYYVYSIWQENLFAQIKQWCPEVQFVHGVDELQRIDFNPNLCTAVVLDDQQQALLEAKEYGVNLMTTDVHHKNIIMFFICQSLFFRSRHNALVNRQASYVIMFRNKRSMFEPEQVGRQILQLKPCEVHSLYKDASSYRDYSYLLYDTNPETIEHRQLVTSILTDDDPKVFYHISDEYLRK